MSSLLWGGTSVTSDNGSINNKGQGSFQICFVWGWPDRRSTLPEFAYESPCRGHLDCRGRWDESRRSSWKIQDERKDISLSYEWNRKSSEWWQVSALKFKSRLFINYLNVLCSLNVLIRQYPNQNSYTQSFTNTG